MSLIIPRMVLHDLEGHPRVSHQNLNKILIKVLLKVFIIIKIFAWMLQNSPCVSKLNMM